MMEEVLAAVAEKSILFLTRAILLLEEEELFGFLCVSKDKAVWLIHRSPIHSYSTRLKSLYLYFCADFELLHQKRLLEMEKF